MKKLLLVFAAMLVSCGGDDNECPDGGSLHGIAGDEQWCAIYDSDGYPVRHGPYRYWDHETGTVLSSGHYCHGLECGEWTVFFANGAKQSVREYNDNGEMCGMLVEWDDQGNVTNEEDKGPC